MHLQTLLTEFAITNCDFEVTGLCLDSRKVTPGQVFIALSPADQSALTYVQQALARGASAVIYDPKDTDISAWLSAAQPSAITNASVNKDLFITITGLQDKLGAIAARYYAHPSSQLDVIGITGTNGKTSCTQFLGQLLEACGIIGTLGWGEWGNLAFTGYTTPDALATQAMLAELVNQNKRYVAMEVSSHGLAEGRVNSVHFKGVVLTNISRDHLDFHGSMAAYIATKQSLFNRPDTEFAVFNLDDELSAQFIAATPKTVDCWGFTIIKTGERGLSHSNTAVLQPKHIVYAQNIRHQLTGLSFEIIWQDQLQTVEVPLYGGFNVENILAVVTVMLALGHPLAAIVVKLQLLKPVTGRMQRFGHNHSALIFVDYAHTPDALKKALKSARQYCKSKLWVVFGCGGDRDVGKRAEMGACAEEFADQVIITDDNPRSENPEAIVNNILSGCLQNQLLPSKRITVIHDRAQAIQTAIKQSTVDDCIVIAGKGHEHYQEIKDQKIPFSDADVVMSRLAEVESNK